jgi:hypothetical protein
MLSPTRPSHNIRQTHNSLVTITNTKSVSISFFLFLFAYQIKEQNNEAALHCYSTPLIWKSCEDNIGAKQEGEGKNKQFNRFYSNGRASLVSKLHTFRNPRCHLQSLRQCLRPPANPPTFRHRCLPPFRLTNLPIIRLRTPR